MSAEEEQRRQVRRERNKLAAARCRKRRMDHTNELLEVYCKNIKFIIGHPLFIFILIKYGSSMAFRFTLKLK